MKKKICREETKEVKAKEGKIKEQIQCKFFDTQSRVVKENKGKQKK